MVCASAPPTGEDHPDRMIWMRLPAARFERVPRVRRAAGRKGHGFFLYFTFSLFFFPLALLTAYLVKDRAGTAWTQRASGPRPDFR